MYSELISDIKSLPIKTVSRKDKHTYGFAMGLNNPRTALHFSNLDSLDSVSWACDKEHRQFVMTIKEKGREVSLRNVQAPYAHEPQFLGMSFPADVQRFLEGSVDINFPESSFVTKTTCVEISHATGRPIYLYDLEISVPTHTRHFLIGYDDIKLFISELKSEASSVEHAHKLLRPKGVPADALRHGEFFFVPATHEEILSICQDTSTELQNSVPLDEADDSGHYAECLIFAQSGDDFAIGKISHDVRNRHKDLMLSTFHKVVPNNEVPNPDKDYD